MNKHIPVTVSQKKILTNQVSDIPYYRSHQVTLKVREKSPLSYMLLGLVVLITWASLFDIDEAVRGSGKVISDNRTQLIQAADGGVLSKLLVREGQEVAAGQIVAELESSRANAAYEESRSKLAAQEIALLRAQAEAQGKLPNFSSFDKYP